MRECHGFKNNKCNHCNFRSEYQCNVLRHIKSFHKNINFKCEQCDFKCNRKDNLKQHIKSKHMEKNIKCKQCDYITNRKDMLKIHIQAKHTQKKCNECEYTILSKHDMNKHENTLHGADDELTIYSSNKIKLIYGNDI